MTVTGLGTARKSGGLPILTIVSAALVFIALVMFALELSRFAQGRDLLPADITVAGVPVTDLKQSEAASAWEQIYAQPVELDFQGNTILLNPADIGWRTNSELMAVDLTSKVSATNNYWLDFWNYLWRQPTSPVEVPLIADYQEAKLRDFLQDVAARYEQPASTAKFDSNSMTFGSGLSGQRLDIEASIVEINAALHRPTNRKVKLLMKGEGARPADMSTLRQAIMDYFSERAFLPDGQNTSAGVVVIDLETGEEVAINGDVAFSAASTIKIPILLNIFRQLTFAPNADTRWLMAASILCSINSSSNFLMQIAGGVDGSGNAFEALKNGLNQVTNTVQALGAKNTFISAPLYVADKSYEFAVQAPKTSPNPNFNTRPDLFSQTTPEDMAALLHLIYDCDKYGSGLIAAFPENYTQTECKQMIELLSGNIIGRMIELGVAPGVRIAHKNGWATANSGYVSADAGIIYSPGGNYILSIYMWEQLEPGQEVGKISTWETMEGISRIVYNYFNADNPLVTTRVPENPYGAIDCVMPANAELVDLNNIRNGRFDENGFVLPTACYGFPSCTTAPDSKLGTGQSTPVNTPAQEPPNDPNSGSISPTETKPPPPPK